MTRYRLRFLLQEIDLAQGDTLIGRSASCHVSIEDPLVSRQHARVRIEGEHATIEDLGSRNGLLVGGRTIQGVQELKDGDRIRIGTQEMVFCSVGAPSQRGRGPGTRPTGFMTHCAECDLPYPAELLECPSCGSTERTETDTLSGVGESQQSWTLQLLVEVLSKAQSLGRADDVERVLGRARANVEELLQSGRTIEREPLDAVADAAAWLAVTSSDAAWAVWMLETYAALAWVPPERALAHLARLEPTKLNELGEHLGRVVAAVRSRLGPDPDEQQAFSLIERLCGLGS